MKIVETKKLTFATLKSLAKNEKLYHIIKSEFDGMIDGMSDIRNREIIKTTVKNLENFKTGCRNYLTIKDETTIELSNCCYSIEFHIINH